MPKPFRVLLIGLAALGLAAPASADEIIYFTNGTSMPVRAHTLEKDMIRVDLGNNSFIAFPLELVEKVEAAGRGVASIGGPKNRMVEGVADGHAGQRPRANDMQVAEAEAPAQPAEQPVDRDDKGMAVHRPFRGSGGSKSKIGFVGSPSVLGRSPINGVRSIGNKTVIGEQFPQNKRANLRGIQMRTDQPPPQQQQQQPDPNNSEGTAQTDNGSNDSSQD